MKGILDEHGGLESVIGGQQCMIWGQADHAYVQKNIMNLRPGRIYVITLCKAHSLIKTQGLDPAALLANTEPSHGLAFKASRGIVSNIVISCAVVRI
jgi:hypothetical protein